MKIRDLHRWDVTYREAVALQNRLRRRLDLRGRTGRIRRLAGADVSYERDGDRFIAGVVVLRYPGLELVEEATAVGRASFPYIPGLLVFREGPILLRAFARLSARPDVVIFDGHGVAHPRGLGIASHLGLYLGLPSIGCAKSLLVGEYREPGRERGERAPLLLEGRRVGTVVRTRTGVKPVFISPGHRMDIRTANRITLGAATRYRLPEATRLAHALVNRVRVSLPPAAGG